MIRDWKPEAENCSPKDRLKRRKEGKEKKTNLLSRPAHRLAGLPHYNLGAAATALRLSSLALQRGLSQRQVQGSIACMSSCNIDFLDKATNRSETCITAVYMYAEMRPRPNRGHCLPGHFFFSFESFCFTINCFSGRILAIIWFWASICGLLAFSHHQL